MTPLPRTLPSPVQTGKSAADLAWGFSTLGCTSRSLEQICAVARSFDVHRLEIRGVGDTLDAPAYFDTRFSGAPEIRSLLARYDQQVVMLDTSFKLIGSGASDREALAAYAGWAEALQVPYLRVFGGGSMDAPLGKEGMREATENLKWWDRRKADAGWKVDLLLETHDGFSSSDRCLALHEHSPSGLPIIWDTHHTWKQGEAVKATWEHMGHLVRHVHIKDSLSVPSARHDHTYVLPGKGEFPARETLDLLAGAGYAGVVSLEWELKWHPYLPPLEEALEACRAAGWR